MNNELCKVLTPLKRVSAKLPIHITITQACQSIELPVTHHPWQSTKSERLRISCACISVRIFNLSNLFSCQRCVRNGSIGPLAFKRQCHVLWIAVARVRVHGSDDAWASKRAKDLRATGVYDLDQWTKRFTGNYSRIVVHRRVTAGLLSQVTTRRNE